MDFTGKPMLGDVFVSPAGVERDAALERGVELAATLAATLPAKKPKRLAR